MLVGILLYFIKMFRLEFNYGKLSCLSFKLPIRTIQALLEFQKNM